MRIFLWAAFAQSFLSKFDTTCYDAASFWVPENRALGGQTLDKIIEQIPIRNADNFYIYQIHYNGHPAHFKYINIRSKDELENARNEVGITRKLSHLEHSTTFLDCVEGQNFIGIFTYIQGSNLLNHIFSTTEMPIIERLELLYKSAEAILELHKLNIAHGDIALENFSFKYSSNKKVVISNFSKAVDMNQSALPQNYENKNSSEVTHIDPTKAFAKDVWQFALMSLAVVNPEFGHIYYSSLSLNNETSPRHLNLDIGDLSYLELPLQKCDKHIKKHLSLWLTAGLRLSFEQILSDIELIAQEVLLENKIENFGIEPLTREKVTNYMSRIKSSLVSKNSKQVIEQPVKKGIIKKLINKLKEKISPSKKEEDCKEGVKCWFTEKLSIFNNAMNNFKKRIFRAFSYWSDKTSSANIHTNNSSDNKLFIKMESATPIIELAEENISSVDAPIIKLENVSVSSEIKTRLLVGISTEEEKSKKNDVPSKQILYNTIYPETEEERSIYMKRIYTEITDTKLNHAFKKNTKKKENILKEVYEKFMKS